MTAHRDVELFLRAQFEATADPTVLDGQIDSVLSATAGRRQQPVWLAALRSYPMTTTARSFGRPLSTPALALLMILALLIAITAVGVTTGTFRLPPAPVVNGPIVFGRYSANLENTEIYLARPDGSGIHRVLAGAYECPQFSPDGKSLLFERYITDPPEGGYRLVVAPVDGRSATPIGPTHRTGTDGRSHGAPPDTRPPSARPAAVSRG